MANCGTASALAFATGLFVLVAAPVFLSQKMYRGIWRFASINDLITITRAVTLTILIFVPVLFLFTRLNDLPRSTLVINWFALLALLGAPRFAYRLAKDRYLGGPTVAGDTRRIPTLVVGTGGGADLFIRATMRPESQYGVVGLLSETRGRVGRGMHGIEVLGTLDQFEEVVAALKMKGSAPERLILSDDSYDGTVVRQLFDRADALGISLARLPKLTDLKDGVADKVALRPVAVEDLLGRPQTVLDRTAMRALIQGRRVLVTGAGGSIGSELVRQIAECVPASLCLVDSCEFALYTIDREVAERHPGLARSAAIADVRDRVRIDSVIGGQRPELAVPRRRAQARADGRGQSAGGLPDQCGRHAHRRRVVRGSWRRPDGPDIDRQGGQPDQCHGGQPNAWPRAIARPSIASRATAGPVTSRSASAMCWVRPARWYRCSSGNWRPAGRSPSPTPR